VKLDSFMLADAALATDGKLYVHGGGLREITPPGLPWLHPQLAYVLRVEIEDGDETRDHEIRIAMRAPSGEELAPPVIVPILGQGIPPGEPDRATFLHAALTVAHVPFQEAGAHRVEVYFDNEPAKTELLYVEAPA
jgi:Family of unknown function (DUF6941)